MQNPPQTASQPTPSPATHRPRITTLFTGGTISMTHSARDGSAVPTLTGEDIQAAVPGLSERFDLECIQFGHFPGPHMTLEHMLKLHHAAKQAIARGAQGVVIAHGTDTLEESAFFLDMLHTTREPIVFVGAMRTKDELSWDGPVNLYGACLVASDPRTAGRGVLVTMNNTIHAASEVTKTYTEAIDTFVTPDYGSLGMVELGRIMFHREPLRRVRCTEPSRLPRVDLIEAAAGSDGTILRAAANSGAEGLVVAAMGRGNLPPLMADALAEVVASGVTVVVTSRCWGGRVAPVYGYAGGGARLVESGAIFSPWLGALKARIALCLGLAAGMSRDELRAMFGSE